MPKVTIDASTVAVVAVCSSPSCTWRSLTHTRPSAQRLAAFHVRFVHDDPDEADRLRDAAKLGERRSRRRPVLEGKLKCRVPMQTY